MSSPAGEAPAADGAREIADLPGPRRLPLLGNAHSLRRPDRFVFKLEEWCRLYGPIHRFDLGPRRTVVLGDPADINVVLRHRPDVFRRGVNMDAIPKNPNRC